MSGPCAGRFRPLSVPRDTRPIVKFTGEFGAAIDQHLRDAADGRWDTPVGILIDPQNPESIAHWVYKSINPLVRGAKLPGTDVEALLEPFMHNRFELLPEGFTIETEVSMSASGDLMATPGLDGARDRLFLDVDDLIFGADISYANLESTLTEAALGPTEFSAGKTPMINFTPDQYETVVSHRGRKFDVLHLANNHILDCGEEGVQTTLARLKQDGIAQVGVNQTEGDALMPRITELAGLRIGWVAHTFSVNFKPFPDGKPWIVNMTAFHLVPDPDIRPILAQIKACREAGCDLVIAAMHWGMEFELFPTSQQIDWAHQFAEAGADLVIGHHPHVPQPVEIYRLKRDPGCAVPILYSIGNLSTLLSHPAMVLSLVARIGLVKGRYRGKVETRIASLELTPVALVAEADRADEIVRLVPLAQLDRSVKAGSMRDYVDDVARFADLVIGDDWRGDALVSA
jgi:poly-gamma-glutamate capsule biosynthesis protein CapA/YwtB (metallophosphatase superfamily)